MFDSGIGGLTVLKSIMEKLPSERLIYFGDTARLPYGTKSKVTVTRFSREIVSFLMSKNPKMIVVACNTASAVSLDYLRNIIRLPLIGVVESGALGAIRETKNKRVGVIGTKATIRTGAYSKAIKSLDPEVDVYEVTPLLVPLVEEYWIQAQSPCRSLESAR